jgi:hypothetical protein
MNNCDRFLMARMALADGEESDVPAGDIDRHFSQCAQCRDQAADMRRLAEIFQALPARAENADLWSAVEAGIGPGREPSWWLLGLPGVFLFIYKLAEWLPHSGWGFAFKVLPLIAVVVLFAVLRENPFSINTSLAAEE